MISDLEIQKEVHKLIKFGLNIDQIIRVMSKEVPESNVEKHRLIQESVEHVCEEYPDYDSIQFFMRSKVIVDKDGEDNRLYLYNPRCRELRTIDKSRLQSMISPKLEWGGRRHTCEFTYNPFGLYKVKKVDGQWKYNLYEPPFWLEDHFHSGGSSLVSKIDNLPEIYNKFFSHLVDGDENSFNYILDWLANSLRARNYCILATIGNQGIGKGVLGEIMKGLHGKSNYVLTGKRAISKEFNGQIAYKRLVYLDEVKVTTIDQENTLKGWVNDFLEVEFKGVDPKTIANYASVYYSSNNLDSIRLTDDDRRFSIVELTDKKLLTAMKAKEISALLSDVNISKLASFLYNRSVDADKMMKVFTSARTELIRSSSLNRWQEDFMDKILPNYVGQTVPFKEIQDEIEDVSKLANAPGRTLFGQFCELYASKFKMKNTKIDGKQQWAVQFLEERK